MSENFSTTREQTCQELENAKRGFQPAKIEILRISIPVVTNFYEKLARYEKEFTDDFQLGFSGRYGKFELEAGTGTF